MKVIQIWKPLQDKNTKPEHIELNETVINTNDHLEVLNKIPYWCVRSEMLKPNETYHQWLKRTEEKISTGTYKEKGVQGIYLYDIQPIGGIIIGSDTKEMGTQTEIGMMVRYDYIYKDSLKND